MRWLIAAAGHDELGDSADPDARPRGASFSLRGYLALGDRDDSTLSLIGELGYKTKGFVEGYRMGASPIAMIGLGLGR